jgi:microcystin-dependent protein
MIAGTGGVAAHENRQPSLVPNWIMALQGVFPLVSEPLTFAVS